MMKFQKHGMARVHKTNLSWNWKVCEILRYFNQFTIMTVLKYCSFLTQQLIHDIIFSAILLIALYMHHELVNVLNDLHEKKKKTQS